MADDDARSRRARRAIAAGSLCVAGVLGLLLVLPLRPPPAAPPAVLVNVTISSIPLGAKVVLDGQGLGETPVIDRPVSEGEHALIVLSHDHIAERTIDVRAGRPQRYVWDNPGGRWLDEP